MKPKSPPEIQVPTDAEIVKAVKKLEKMQKEVRSASGSMGDYVGQICEDQAFDKWALGMARRLHTMADEKFRIRWKHLLAYAEALGFDARADEQPDLPMEAEKEPAATNVRKLRTPRAVAEQAGEAG